MAARATRVILCSATVGGGAESEVGDDFHSPIDRTVGVGGFWGDQRLALPHSGDGKTLSRNTARKLFVTDSSGTPFTQPLVVSRAADGVGVGTNDESLARRVGQHGVSDDVERSQALRRQVCGTLDERHG